MTANFKCRTRSFKQQTIIDTINKTGLNMK